MSGANDAEDRIVDFIDALLAVVSGTLTTAGRPITRIVHSPGVPTWDCEQVAAWADQHRIAGTATNPDGSMKRSGPVRLAVNLNVGVLRCVTAVTQDGDVPSAAVVDADGKKVNRDSWIVFRDVVRAFAGATLGSRCDAWHVRPLVVFAPGGGLAGFQLTIEVTL